MHTLVQFYPQLLIRCLRLHSPLKTCKFYIDFRFDYIQSSLSPRIGPSRGEYRHLVQTSDFTTSNHPL